MPRIIAQSKLNASTLDILNVIRKNANVEYQNSVPKITKASEIRQVGEVIYGSPALSNQFINQLVNRIALVAVNSAIFYNPYRILKKGYLEFGETIEEVFVDIAKVVEYNPELAEQRELKRTIPNVETAFHPVNWRVMYPVTIQEEDLRMAFLSIEGVQDLITKIINQIYTAASYDEFLLFKYMLIKAMSHGKVKAVAIDNIETISNSAVAFRGISNCLGFMSADYNESGVLTATPRENQVIFMDAMFNAKFDVDVLSAAFNMDKADYMGRLFLIDNWTSFDNSRFQAIRSVSDGIEEVTAEELTLLSDVKAVIMDNRWFQVYDKLTKFKEREVASGLYWNYFFHTWKVISRSPFANAVMFVDSTASISLPETVKVEITGKDISHLGTVFTMVAQDDNAELNPTTVQFVQTDALVKAGIAIQKFGAVIIPSDQTATSINLQLTIEDTDYFAQTAITSASSVGDVISFAKTAPAVASTRPAKK